MRLVEEGFGESIPAVVIHVYSMRLTVRGEVSLRGATHLEQLPKNLTSPASRQVQGILTGHGLPKYRPIFRLPRTAAIRSRIFSPQKILVNLGHAHLASWAPHIESVAQTRFGPFQPRGEGQDRQARRIAYPSRYGN
ncbi:hypothetical protein AYM40_20475 [Paraburkholderia phytofirmans OLGA172]|uniref:Uncharacterized protein n=1 Tax=Paraburkholderia phytofirmans OLGA172 TaxID=1417228 RepID=A0A160FQA2_9BURK|nr:hypothetical protein AYM40_20475 [Paraburkholderia phytofirmans OLGA172]